MLEPPDVIQRIIPRIGEAISGALATFLPGPLVYILMGLIGTAAVLAFLLPNQLMIIWFERRFIGWFQLRHGPNRVGPYGLLQSVADAVKILMKESIFPAAADLLAFRLSPIAAFVPAFMPWAVIPIAPGTQFVDLNVGVLYILGITSISTISIFMAGWSSNNKYALLGAMRTVAQMVSYEVPLVLSLVPIVLIVGSMKLSDIVAAQSGIFFENWFIFRNPLALITLYIAASAELNRTPFDIVEAESELIAGVHTEYSGFMFSLFYLAEYTAMITMSAIIATMFLGGWTGPILPGIVWFLIKVWFVLFIFVWVRATLPRLRIDQLMNFAWKRLLPVTLGNVFVTAAVVFVISYLRGETR